MILHTDSLRNLAEPTAAPAGFDPRQYPILTTHWPDLPKVVAAADLVAINDRGIAIEVMSPADIDRAAA